MPTVVITDNASGGDYSGTEDTILHQDGGGNFGSEAFVSIGTYDTATDVNRGLFKFTGLSNITGPVTVSSATLDLNLFTTQAFDDGIEVFKVLRNWVESEATWSIYSTGNNWATAGGAGSGDIEATASGSATVGQTTGSYYSFSSAQMAADVEAWINTPSSNYGWLLKYTTPTNLHAKQFESSESATDTVRPKLTVVYEVGTPQTSAPTSDITSGWTPSTGATLYGTIDEASPGTDTDYDYASTAATMEVKFAALTDPTTAYQHQVKYRIAGASTGNLTVSLRQGSSQIASWVHTPPTDITTYTGTLTSAEADSITDYSDLRLRVVSST